MSQTDVRETGAVIAPVRPGRRLLCGQHHRVRAPDERSTRRVERPTRVRPGRPGILAV